MDNIHSKDEQFVYTFHNDLSQSQLPAFKKLQDELNRAAVDFDGYLGQDLSYEPFSENGTTRCVARIRFSSLEDCIHWLDSGIRRQLLIKAEQSMGYSYSSLVEPKSFDQWISAQGNHSTPIWKINFLVWLALYPSVMVLFILGQSSLGRLPLPLNMLISNAITVSITGWLLVPWLSRVYENWLNTRSLRWNLIYSASVLVFLLLFLSLFSLPGFSL